MNQRLAWIDLEMTGLDPKKEAILEVACLITDNDLNLIAQAPTYVVKPSQQFLDAMQPIVRDMHTKSGLLADVAASNYTCAHVEKQLLMFLAQHCQPQTAPLCGNSIWMDKFFIKESMPTLYDFFHYRTIDVTTIKELVKRWYPHNQQANFAKKNTHRALQDIEESINELRYYRKHFFKKADWA